MGAVVVVEVEVAGQEIGALGRGVEGEGVGPFAQECLDEAFGFAVGAWAVGASPGVAEAELATGGRECVRGVAAAVVGEQALDDWYQVSHFVDCRQDDFF